MTTVVLEHLQNISSSGPDLTIDGSGRVGIGTGGVVNTNAHANADDFVIGNTSNRTGMTIVSDPAQNGNIHFSDGGSSGNADISGQITYEHSDNSFRFYANSTTEVLRLTSSGGTVFNNGQDINQNFTVKTSGNSSALFIDGNGGNVGVGTNAPDGKFHVEGSAQNFKVDSTGLIIGKPKPSTAQGISYGTQVDYLASDLSPALGGSSNGWYTLIAGLDDGSYTFHLKTGAHSSCIFQVGTGYAASAQENLQILQFTDNPNSSYLNIKGVRVTDGGGVEVYLYASTPSSFSLSVQAVGNGNFGNPIPFVSTLTKQTGSPTVRDSAYPLFNKTSRFNIMTAQNQPGFHARGSGSWSNPGNADLVFTDVSSSATYNDGGHYNNGNGRFTAPVTGKYILGATLYHRNDSGYDDDTNHQYWYFFKNGVGLTNTNNVIMGYQNNGDADASFPMSIVVKLNSGDYITVRNSNASGSGSYYMNGCEFWGILLS